MKLQAKLKLALSKQRKVIVVKYNTFEKATYDRFLCASIARQTASIQEAYDYIDDITGNGSLNAHFKHLYDEATRLSDDQLDSIMKSSMYPILKIDRSAWYDYFEELNISLYKNKLYEGDLAERSIDEISQIIGINEIILDKDFEQQRSEKKPQPYDVILEDSKVRVLVGKEYIEVSQELFSSVVIKELDGIDRYKGALMLSPEGEGWQILTNASLNNLLSGNRFYYEKGNHYLIRPNDVRETIVAKMSGLYLFKENILPYSNNPELCEKVLEFLFKTDELKFFNPKNVFALLKFSNYIVKRGVVNYFLERQDSKEFAEYGLDMICSGIVLGWNKSALEMFLKYAKATRELEAIYKIDSTIGFKLRQLIHIDKTLLTPKHLDFVNEYIANLDKQREVIKGIIGDVTSKGLRERAKELKSDADTKKFSALCNKLIGHVERDIDKADADELKVWLKEAQELESLAKIIEQKLSKIVK